MSSSHLAPVDQEDQGDPGRNKTENIYYIYMKKQYMKTDTHMYIHTHALVRLH